MTQNPYAQFGNPGMAGAGAMGGGGGFEQFPVQTRTSVLAIMSLVFALVCFIPGSGALAVILGGAAIVFISSSRGRLGGLGLAITGVLLGLCATVFWLFVVVSAAQLMKGFNGMFVAPTSNMMAALESGDYATARQNFDAKLNAAVTDQQLGEFVTAYHQHVGSFQSMPGTVMDFFKAYGEVGSLMQNYNSQNEFPMPATFDKGLGLILAGMPRGNAKNVQQQPGGIMPQLTNLGVLVGPGTEVWLLDPRTLKPVDNSASSGSGTSGGTGETGADTDKDAETSGGTGG